jgi:hypothetical protein
VGRHCRHRRRDRLIGFGTNVREEPTQRLTGRHQIRQEISRNADSAQQVRRPRSLLDIQQARRRCIRQLGDARTAQPAGQEIRDQQDLVGGGQRRGALLRGELIDRVERLDLRCADTFL